MIEMLGGPRKGPPLTWILNHQYIDQLGTFLFTIQTDVDKDQVKAAIRAQQDKQIDNASTINCNSLNNIFYSLN